MAAETSSDRNRNPDGASTEVARLESNDEVVGQRLGDNFVLVELKSNRIFELNRTAARFWDLLQSESDPRRIEEQMLAEFDVSGRTLKAEIDRLVVDLLSEDLVRVID